MRNKKAFLSFAIVATAGLLDARAAMANFCTTPIGGTITVISVPPGAADGVTGACPVIDPGFPACASHGGWTGIQYRITGGQATDLVSTLVTVNNTVLPNQVYTLGGNTLKPACTAAAGGGDLSTDLGEYSCHERALRIQVAGDGTFWVLVRGNKQPVPTSIAQRRGNCPIKSTQILGLGLDLPEGCVSSCGNFAPSQTLTKTEIVKFEACEVQFTKNLLTGAVLDGPAGFDNTGTVPPCTLSQGPVGDLTVSGPVGFPPGAVSFGDGTVSSGDESCNTRFIGGRYYTVCKTP